MSLDLGELVGSIGLDITPFERALTAGDSGLKSFAADGESTAKAAGQGIGVAMAMGLATIPADASEAAAGVKLALDQIPVDAKVAADQAAAAFGVGVDEMSRVMEELPKNVRGTVKQTSAEFRELPYEMKAAILQVEANAAAGLAQIPPEARSAGQEAARQLGAGLSATKAEAESAGARAGDGFASSFREKVKDAGKVAGVAVGAALSVGVIDNINLEQGRLKVAAQLGLTATQAERIGRIAGRVYASNFGDGMDEVNVAVGAVISSLRGMRTASEHHIGHATRLALAYGDVFEIDIPRAVSVAGTVIRSGLADSATEAFDLMTQASSRVPAALREDVLDAVEEYAPFFKSLGYDGPAAFALLVKGAEKGMYGIDKAGDAVKEFTIRSTDMSTSTKAAYKKIGLDARKMADDILAGGDRAQLATQKVITGLLKIESPSKRANAAIALFGTPLEDLSVRQVPKFLHSLENSSGGMDGWRGSAQKMADTAGGGVANSIETSKRKIIEWGRSVIEAHGPTTVLAGAVAAFGPAALSIIGPMAQIIAARAAQTAAATTAATAETAAHTATKVGWISSAATAMASGITMAAAWLIAMGPIILVVAAIAGVAFLIYKYWDEIKAYTVAIFDWLVGFVKDHFTLILTVILGPLGFIVAQVIKHWDEVKSFTAAALDWVIEKAKAWGPYILGALLGPLGLIVVGVIKHWDQVKSGTKAAWDAVVDFVKAIPGKLLGFFMKWTLAGIIIKHWDEAKDGTIRVATSIVNWVADLPGRIVGKLASLGGQLWDVATSAFGRLRDAAEKRVVALLSYVAGIPAKMVAKLRAGVSIMLGVGRDLIGGLITGIIQKAQDLWNELKSITDKIPLHKGPPSKDKRLLRATGVMIMQGLIDAIGSKDRDLTDQLEKVTTLIERTMSRRYKNDKLAEAAARAVIKGLQDERREMLVNERARDRIAAKLEAARQRLRDMRQEALDYARSIQDAIVAYGNITQFVDQETGTVTAADIVAGLQDRVTDAFEYTAALEQLSAMGLSQDYIDQLTAAGVEGGLATAQALLAGGQAAIDQVNFLNSALNLAGAQLGDSLSQTMYGSGISAAQQLVVGLEHEKEALERTGRRLARAFVRALKEELGSGLADLGIDLSQIHDSNKKAGGANDKNLVGQKASAVPDRTDEVLAALAEIRDATDGTTGAVKGQPRTQLQIDRKGKK